MGDHYNNTIVKLLQKKKPHPAETHRPNYPNEIEIVSNGKHSFGRNCVPTVHDCRLLSFKDSITVIIIIIIIFAIVTANVHPLMPWPTYAIHLPSTTSSSTVAALSARVN